MLGLLAAGLFYSGTTLSAQPVIGNPGTGTPERSAISSMALPPWWGTRWCL